MEGKRKRNLSKYNLSPGMELILQQQIQKLRERMGLKKLKGCQDTKNSETSQLKKTSNQKLEESLWTTTDSSSCPIDQEASIETKTHLDIQKSGNLSAVRAREEDLKYQQELLKFEKVKMEVKSNQKMEKNLKVRAENPARSFSTLHHTTTETRPPVHGQKSEKVSNPNGSEVACKNLQLQCDLNLEDSRVDDIANAQADGVYTETEEHGRVETSGEKPEVKRPRMTEGELHHCTKCEKVFNTAWELILHYEAHLLQSSYKCDICGVAVFNYAAALWAHKRECKRKVEGIHFQGNSRELSTFEENSTLQSQLHNIAPAAWNKFPCDICPRIFSQVYALKEHKDVVHFGKRYCCRFCDKEFCSRSYFGQHEKECEQNQMKK